MDASSSRAHNSNDRYSILVAEDDVVMRNIIKAGLERSGFAVHAVGDGSAALRHFSEFHFDLVILDIKMPEMDGHEVCRQLRRRTTVPIIFVTTESRIDDVVSGYELGADIYVTKPFSVNELVLRTQALLRRVEAGRRNDEADLLFAGNIVVDRNAHEVTIDGDPVELTPNEYAMLCFFMEHANMPLEKDRLLQEIWGYIEEDDANLLRVTIRRLRAKIEPVPSKPTYLRTVRGTGYIFVDT